MYPAMLPQPLRAQHPGFVNPHVSIDLMQPSPFRLAEQSLLALVALKRIECIAQCPHRMLRESVVLPPVIPGHARHWMSMPGTVARQTRVRRLGIWS